MTLNAYVESNPPTSPPTTNGPTPQVQEQAESSVAPDVAEASTTTTELPLGRDTEYGESGSTSDSTTSGKKKGPKGKKGGPRPVGKTDGKKRSSNGAGLFSSHPEASSLVVAAGASRRPFVALAASISPPQC